MGKYLRDREVAEMIKPWEAGWGSPFDHEDHSVNTSEMFADWESRAPTPSPGKEPEPVRVERALPPHEHTPKIGLPETVDVLTKVLGSH